MSIAFTPPADPTAYIRTRWIPALRSGDYTQATRVLRREEGGVLSFCCLGVLCDLLIRDGYLHTSWDISSLAGDDGKDGRQDLNTLPFVVANAFDLTPVGCPKGNVQEDNSLAGKNDTGATFDQIADILAHRTDNAATA